MSDVVVMTYAENTENNGENWHMHIKFSTDYGANWTAEDKFTDGASVTGFPTVAGQGVVIAAPNGNLIFLYWGGGEGTGTMQSISTDGGKIWGAPGQITISGIDATANGNTFASDQAMVIGSVIYVSAIHAYDGSYCVLIKSTNNGITWSYVGRISDVDSGEAGITCIGVNSFVAIVRGAQNQAYYTQSTNAGVTWSACELINNFGTGGRWHVWTRSQLKGDVNWWLDPVLVMCGFLDTSGDGSARQNSVWVSENRGNTWSSAFALDTPAGGNDGGYGDAFYNPNTDEYVFVNYKGLPSVADVKQYNVTIDGI